MSVQKTTPPQIQICTEAWEQVDADAFLCPTNSDGSYEQYPSSHIRTLSGLPLADLIRPHTPIAVGAAFVTGAGKMRARNLIHVPHTERAGTQVLVEDIARATAAAIVVCELNGYQSLAVPLMGAYDHGIPAEEAARAIHSEFKSHRGERPAKILLMARNPDEIEVFELAIEGIA